MPTHRSTNTYVTSFGCEVNKISEENSFSRVMNTLDGSEANRIPCINPASVATTQFMKTCSCYWPEAHKNPVKMAKLASAAHKICGLDNVSVPFCMTVEAEVLGAPINFFEDQIRWPTAKRFIAEKTSDLRLLKKWMM